MGSATGGGIAGGLTGAGLGALIGTMIMPGIGTAIGAGIGGAAGSAGGAVAGHQQSQEAKGVRNKQDDMQRKQDQAASEVAGQLLAAPRKLDPQTVQRGRRFRSGLAANIRSAGLGPTPMAPAALTGKTLLGS